MYIFVVFRWFFCERPHSEIQGARGDAGGQTYCGSVT